MFKQLYITVLLATLQCVYTENHEWEVAVAIDDQIQFLDRNFTVLGISQQTFIQLKGLAFDDIRHEFLVSDMDDMIDNIYKVPLKKSAEASPIVKDLPDDVKYLAVDPVDDVLYWSDSANNRIMSISLNEPDAQPEPFMKFDHESPQGIAIDSCRRKIYWASSNYPSSTIKRADLNGTNVETIARRNIFLPSGITIDHGARRIYWADHGEGNYYKIESAKLDGSDRKIVYQDRYGTPVGLSVNDEYLYFTDEDNNMLFGLSKIDFTLGPKIRRKFPKTPRGLVSKHHDYMNMPECQEVTDIIQEYHAESTTEFFVEVKESLKCLNYGQLTATGCKCLNGYSGSRCEIDSCHNFCYIGECRVSSHGYPSCNCPVGFTGERCQQELCKDYCMHNGICKVDSSNKLSCDCPTGYSGQKCEKLDTPQPPCSCEGGVIIISSEDGKPMCSCNKTVSYQHEPDIVTAASVSELLTSETEVMKRLHDPIIMIFMFTTVLLLFVIVVMSVALYRMRNRRPRIKKRIIVNKNVTPLTCRPNSTTEQCEITIENCCNMNICETPCFEPEQIRGFQRTKTEEKKTLLTSMENGEDLY
ncbi:cueball [Carabus blaptoides fortunei]